VKSNLYVMHQSQSEEGLRLATEAANGAIALSIIQNQPPDLVLKDVMMPEMDGFELLHTLRNQSQTKGIPIILLSAQAGEEAAIEGLEAVADDYIIKPFSALNLMTRIKEWEFVCYFLIITLKSK
jgi:DNA-binding response OmpR family regulator